MRLLALSALAAAAAADDAPVSRARRRSLPNERVLLVAHPELPALRADDAGPRRRHRRGRSDARCQCAAGTFKLRAVCGRGGYDEIGGDCAGLVCTAARAAPDPSGLRPAGPRLLTDTNEPPAPNEILVETEGLNGTFAKTCVACAPGTFSVWTDETKGGAFFEGDPYTCRRCPDARMNADCTACAEGYSLVGDAAMGPQSCIKTLHVTEAEEAFGLLSEATSLKILNLQTGEPHPRNKKEDSADGTAI